MDRVPRRMLLIEIGTNMKTKIGIYISNYGVKNVDISSIKTGNPGIGGTQYEMFLFATFFEKNNKYELYVFLDDYQCGFECSNTHIIKEESDLFSFCSLYEIDMLILRANCFLKQIGLFNKTKIIYWVHNFINYEACKMMSNSSNVKAVVFVSKQQYDFYRELDVISKSTYIFNTLFIPEKMEHLKKNNYDVVFTGNLVPITRFHIATSIWPYVVKRIPKARLHVIGSGKNGNRTFELGKRGIAEKSYEDIVFAPLEKAKVVETVVFHGNMGIEKNDIIKTCSLAISPNKEETFCISACEYILNTTPVVAIKSGGLADVVIDGKTGYLCRSPKAIAKKIVKILKKNNQLRINEEDILYIRENFGYDAFINRWDELLTAIKNDNTLIKYPPSKPYSISYKWLGILFEKIRKVFHFSDRLSRHYIKGKFK